MAGTKYIRAKAWHYKLSDRTRCLRLSVIQPSNGSRGLFQVIRSLRLLGYGQLSCENLVHKYYKLLFTANRWLVQNPSWQIVQPSNGSRGLFQVIRSLRLLGYGQLSCENLVHKYYKLLFTANRWLVQNPSWQIVQPSNGSRGLFQVIRSLRLLGYGLLSCENLVHKYYQLLFTANRWLVQNPSWQIDICIWWK